MGAGEGGKERGELRRREHVDRDIKEMDTHAHAMTCGEARGKDEWGMRVVWQSNVKLRSDTCGD